jgi:hypothetical protein
MIALGAYIQNRGRVDIPCRGERINSDAEDKKQGTHIGWKVKNET